MYLSHCPVTGGVPTRMSGAAFARMCEERRGTRRRKLNSVAVVTGSKACEQCKGRRQHWPPELEIIDIKPEELEMGKTNGRCAICDAKTEVKNTRGHMVCATCQKILSYVDNHQERIEAAARLLGKTLGGGDAADPADHAIAEAVRACFGRDLSVQELGERCREEAEKAAMLQTNLSQYELWMGKALHILGGALPQEDEGLDDTRSFADIMDLAERAARKMSVDATVVAGLRAREESGRQAWRDIADKLGCSEDAVPGAVRVLLEAQRRALTELEELKTSATLNTVNELDQELDRARATIAEQEEIIAEQADQLDRANVALPASDPVDDALLKWARERLEAGNISLRVEEAA